jgi:predicted dehydrogenase
VEAGKHLGNVEVQITALADAMPDRLNGVRGGLAKAGQEVPEDHCFVGFDAYKKLIDSGVDIVLLTTPPNFRPVHFQAAIEAGKHVFMEKPVAVDPVGCRRMYEAGKTAAEKKLSIVAGTCLRHSTGYAATRKAVVEDGAVGAIKGGAIWYCVGQLWFRQRKPDWSNAEYLVRNWLNFACMSGDHVTEQYIHTLDMLNWHMNAHPEAVTAFGWRHRRKTGDQYDMFSIDYEYPGGVRVHGSCRQINGCWSRANQGELAAEKGTISFGGRGAVRTWDGKAVPLPKFDWHGNMYVQEHVVLVDSILNNKAVNHTEEVTDSSLAAIMSRISAYTGQRVTWGEMMKSDLALKPTAEEFETGKVEVPPEVVSVPGKA